MSGPLSGIKVVELAAFVAAPSAGRILSDLGAEVIKVEIDGKKAKVFVSEDQQSIAIGKQGQNVRLASKLTGFDIDIELQKTTAKKKKKNVEDSLLSAIEETSEDTTEPTPETTNEE